MEPSSASFAFFHRGIIHTNAQKNVSGTSTGNFEPIAHRRPRGEPSADVVLDEAGREVVLEPRGAGDADLQIGEFIMYGRAIKTSIEYDDKCGRRGKRC